MKTLKALVVRTAPVLVWLACAAALAAADRPPVNAAAAGAGVGLVPLAPLFLPQHGYTGDLTFLSAPPKKASLSLASTRTQLVESISTDGKAPPPAAYRLRPGDKVTVAVFQEDMLGANNQAIDANGNLLLGLVIGPLHVGGLSVAEAEVAVAKVYRDKGFVTDPRVNLRVEAYAPFKLSSPEDSIYEKYLRLVTPKEPEAPPAPR